MISKGIVIYTFKRVIENYNCTYAYVQIIIYLLHIYINFTGLICMKNVKKIRFLYSRYHIIFSFSLLFIFL